MISVNAGGSDWTSAISGNPTVGACCDLAWKYGGSNIIGCIRGMPGGEPLLCEAAENDKIRARILGIIEEYCRDLSEETGQSVSEVNPTPGTKAGGITTLAEKSMGNIKLRGHSPIQGILSFGEQPSRPGGYILDERHGANDMYQTTSLALTGSQIQLFTTGRGTPHGNALLPVVKITGNPQTGSRFEEFIDINVGGILTGEMTVEEAGKDLFYYLLRVCSGERVKAEINGEYSFGIPPVGKY